MNAPIRATARGPSIFITGAAAGIGRATARRFASSGWFVGLSDIDEAAVLALRDELGGSRCFACRLDVTQAQAWKEALAGFWHDSGGRLDVLFNNAGVAVTAPFETAELARLHQVVDVNFKGVLNGCHAAHMYLKATPNARVINMCSASALYGQPMLASYAATKAAIRSLTEALDIEWQAQGIRVVDILPLFVDTAMVSGEVSRMKTVDRLGVRLTAEDVAAQVWRLARAHARTMKVHTYVGMQTRCFALLAKISPGFMNRWVTARMAGY